MKGIDVTREQMAAAEKFIKIVQQVGDASPRPNHRTQIKWEDLVRLVAHYGAIRARAVAQGGSIEFPGEPHLSTSSEHLAAEEQQA
jgi:hypothetical protein